MDCLKSILEGFCSKGDYLKGGHKYPQRSVEVFCLKFAADLARTVSNYFKAMSNCSKVDLADHTSIANKVSMGTYGEK